MTRRKPKVPPTMLQRLDAQVQALLGAAAGWIRKHLRQRSLLVWLVPAFVLAALWVTDPDGGASVKVWIIRMLTAVVAISLAHWGRKAMFDYPEADVRSLFSRAREEPTGAGLALVAVAIVIFGFLMLFSGQVRAAQCVDEVAKAQQYLPVLAAERQRMWADHPRPELLPSLVGHESGCPCMRKCWEPGARLKSAREEGAGLGQITRAYRVDGSLRFDALAELRDRHPALGDWSWENVYKRPDLQLRAVVIMMREGFQYFKRLGLSDSAALAFADAGYNGGNGGVQNDRRACKLSAGCNPAQWFGQVELHCTKSRVALYGQRSACDINRHHVVDVLTVRAAKYRGRA